MIDIKDLQQQPEGQLFDRKSFRIDAKALGVILVAFANADGGDVVVNRMFREMAEAGNPAPEYKQIDFMVKVRLNSVLREEGTNGVGVNEKVKDKVNEKQKGIVDTQGSSQKSSQKIISLMMINP